ncbi:MAG: iron-sulfur cluster assembly scaffold protein [Desulfarculaceae bacterium]|nr:iron-sulfur cluster assembly scaffold protein [Desulfarculaceae bacterium]MCF8073009.1 iron-sulfur cluster assembly scaffold protein [Desulfarculaceae bacterium]MCF8100695.1 iron-sulfur cluster assembly scaffold protein [Desulfarculaceae bacterium]MCF8115433.1 iron-sulfur cluster assembly scaffold protein [Desulfarculaceae bacterium]
MENDQQSGLNLGNHSPSFLTHALTPANVGILPDPDGYAQPKGSCGDYLELYLKVADGKVADARFMTNGCLHTIACGSAMTSLIMGRELGEAAQLSAGDIETELGGLEKEHRHCAALAAATLKAAVRDHLKRKQAPWKQPYQRRRP